MKLFGKTVIRDISQSEDYLRRWYVYVPLLGWSIKLHQIVRADDDRCEHDHPWAFLRVILWGGYVEERNGVECEVKPWRAYWCQPRFRHRILRLNRKTSWSLVFTGPKLSSWGFYTITGYMPWREFVNAARSARILWCADGSKRGERS